MTLIRLRNADFAAAVDTIGSTLKTLEYKGRNLIEPAPEISRYHGGLLAPWPNRIAGGIYQYNGFEYQLPVNEINRNNALHGLVDKVEWNIETQTASEVEFTFRFSGGNIYPSDLELNSHFVVEDTGLRWTISAKNVGSNSCPYGVSIHPYFLTGSDTKVNEFYLQFESTDYLEVDDVRLLPTIILPVGDRDFDFCKRELIGDRFIDHAFQIPKKVNNRRVSITDVNGIGSFIEFDSKANWIQIHTADRDGGEDSRRCLAVEPMSCPPDAFNSGVDLIELEPLESFEMNWLLGQLGG